MSNSLITFGGMDLGMCSPYFRLVDIKDGGVERTITALNPPIRDGEIFGSAKHATRVITVTFAIITEIEALRFEAIKRFNALVTSGAPLPMTIPSRRNMFINAMCAGVPAHTALDWTEEISVQFIAHDPFYYSDDYEIDVALVAGGTANVYVNCPGRIRPVIEQTIASTLTDPTWTCSDGRAIMVQGSVAAGALVIDCNESTVKLDGVSILDDLAIDSQFFSMEPNPAINGSPYVITCSNGAGGRIRARGRWL